MQLYKNQIQFFVHIGLSFSTPNNPSLRYHPRQLCFSLRTSRPTLSGFITRSQEWWDTGVVVVETGEKRKQEVSDIRLRAPIILLAAIFRNPKRKKRLHVYNIYIIIYIIWIMYSYTIQTRKVNHSKTIIDNLQL